MCPGYAGRAPAAQRARIGPMASAAGSRNLSIRSARQSKSSRALPEIHFQRAGTPGGPEGFPEQPGPLILMFAFRSELHPLEIPDSATRVGENASQYGGLTSIHIPAECVEIAAHAYSGTARPSSSPPAPSRTT